MIFYHIYHREIYSDKKNIMLKATFMQLLMIWPNLLLYADLPRPVGVNVCPGHADAECWPGRLGYHGGFLVLSRVL